jgi:prepilin-type processing-associated H-X9-DG protein
MANFVFCDGHVKTMRPANTNPGTGYTQNSTDMWAANRQ